MHSLVLAPALSGLFIVGNFYLWSFKQEPAILFVESMGMGALAFPGLFWLFTRARR